MALLKIFIKKEKKTDLISGMEEMNDEIEKPFLKDFMGSSLIYLPVKVASKEVI